MVRFGAVVSSPTVWLAGVALSALLHAGTFGYITSRPTFVAEKQAPVKVRIVETKPEPPKEEKPAPIPPREKPKPKPEPKKVATERKPPTTPVPDAKPIQGLDKSALSPNGKGPAVPIGNTLMTEDTGERVKEAAPMAADLSADAKLIRDSITSPEYTDAALDANFEGVVLVDVFVDEKGDVKEAELRKPVGFGMDKRIVDAVLKAKFEPRKNRLGGPESGWTEIRFTLQIP